jgi:hypothetical protein
VKADAARIEPTVGTSGAAVKALLKRYRPGPDWATDLAEVRSLLAAQDLERPVRAPHD